MKQKILGVAVLLAVASTLGCGSEEDDFAESEPQSLSPAIKQTLRTKSTCTYATGPFTSVMIPPPECTSPVGICTHGVLTGGLPSSYDFGMNSLTSVGDTPIVKFAANSVVTRNVDGEKYFGQDQGVMDTTDSTAVPFVTWVRVVGGTGPYVAASGNIVAFGTLSFVTGQASGNYVSSVCVPTGAGRSQSGLSSNGVTLGDMEDALISELPAARQDALAKLMRASR